MGFGVVIAGGGVAAIEGLLRLRRLVGDRASVTLVAPNDELVIRAERVSEPFARPGPTHRPIAELAASVDARWIRGTLASVDAERRTIRTGAGDELGYDALLVAVGGRLAAAYEHATTFRDQAPDAVFGQIVEDIEDGYAKSVGFLAPVGPTWLLPLYELALMTAARAHSVGMDDVDLFVVTPDPKPLAELGERVSIAVSELLDRAGVTVHCSSLARVPAATRLLLEPQDAELRPDRMIAMPRIAGPSIPGLPSSGADGFIPIDSHCAVTDHGPVFAAGDATAFPIKHGGIGAQQADAAAAAIARLAGAHVESPPCRPTIEAKLLTGQRPLYLRARLVEGEGFESEVSEEPLWEGAGKVAAEELGAYLASR
ncbi:MAG: hypothetical protein WD399_03860 [Thermoleophilaceae bacterium]